jgi:hypothetical protein
VVQRDTINTSFLENYIYTEYPNGDYTQLLVTYPIINTEDGITYDLLNATAQYIVDESLVFSKNLENPCDGSLTEVIAWEWDDQANCIEYNCTAGGNHEPGEICDGTPDQQPYIECSGGWVVTGCSTGGSSTGTVTDPTTPGNGGGTNNPTDPTNNGNEVIPIVPFDDDITPMAANIECIKVQDFLDDPSNATFIQELVNYSSTTNLNSNQERSVTAFVDNSPLIFGTGTANQNSVPMAYNPLSPIKSFAHNHVNSSAHPSLSVYTFDDLVEIAKLAYGGHLANDVVIFLSTKKGTQYAITIQDQEKFVDLFYMHIDKLDGIKYRNSYLKLTKLYRKYWDRNYVHSLIRGSDTDNDNVLKQFLKFLKEGDAGVTTFKFSDTTFTDFKRMKLGAFGAPKEKDCN